jgi:hypothetical protein
MNPIGKPRYDKPVAPGTFLPWGDRYGRLECENAVGEIVLKELRGDSPAALVPVRPHLSLEEVPFSPFLSVHSAYFEEILAAAILAWF